MGIEEFLEDKSYMIIIAGLGVSAGMLFIEIMEKTWLHWIAIGLSSVGIYCFVTFYNKEKPTGVHPNVRPPSDYETKKDWKFDENNVPKPTYTPPGFK